jgi:hypothetical protein
MEERKCCADEWETGLRDVLVGKVVEICVEVCAE